MKWNKKCLIAVIFFIIAIGFTIRMLEEAAFIKKQYSTVSIRMQTEGVKQDSITAALDNEKREAIQVIPDITAWTQSNNIEIKNDTLGRSVKVLLEYVYGDMSATAPMTLKRGNYAYQEDQAGCVIDTKTAFSLYGTENAVGNSLVYQNHNYYIRGIVKTVVPMIILQGNSITKYNNLELSYQGKSQEQGEMLAEGFLLKYGYAKDYFIIDSNFYGNAIHTLLVLPVWLALLFLICMIILNLWRKRQRYKKRVLLLYGFILAAGILWCVVLLYLITGYPIYLPDKLIPTRFSDFNFWEELFGKIHLQLRQLAYQTPNPKDVLLRSELTELKYKLLLMLFSYLLFIMSIRGIRKGEASHLID